MSWRILLTTAIIFYLFVPAGSLKSFRPQLAQSLISSLTKLLKPLFVPINDPSLYYNTEQLACAAGYPMQVHKIEAEDGHILEVHRIPYGKFSKDIDSNRIKRAIKRFHYGLYPEFKICDNGSSVDTNDRPVVILHHGLSAASDAWLLQGPKYDFATLLADAGYDVWLGNARGNYYSRKHKRLDPSDTKFWDFSFHEMGYYDLPALIDYILKITNQDKVYYIGHSMGTTMFFVMGATRPEYMSKIRLFAAMSPVARLDDSFSKNDTAILFRFASKFAREYEKNKLFEVFPRVSWVPLIIHSFCRKGSPLQDLCYDITMSLMGVNSKLFLRKTLAKIYSHVPAGFSLKTIRHYLQFSTRKKFEMYDYGEVKNLKIYGDPNPPLYNLSKLTCPTALYYSTGDSLVPPEDVEKVIPLLPNVVHVQKISKYNHADYQWAYNAAKTVYADIISQMKKY